MDVRTVIVKLQHYNFEEGEFDKWENLSPEEILNLFDTQEFFEEYKKKRNDDLYPSFIIEKGKEVVKITPVSKNLLDFSFFKPEEKNYYRKRGSLIEIRFLIQKFLLNSNYEIKNDCIEILMADRKTQLKKLKEKNFDYKFQPGNHLWFILFLVFFCFGSIFIHKTAIVSAFVFIVFSPVLYVYIQYFRISKKISLNLTRGKDKFIIRKNNEEAIYSKKKY